MCCRERAAPILLLLVIAGCSRPPQSTRLALEDDGLRLRLGQVLLEKIRFRLHLDGRWLEPTDFERPTIDGDVVRYRPRGSDGPERVELRFSLTERAALVRPVVLARASAPLSLQAFELVVPAGGVGLPGLEDELLFLQHGYQSWSFTGALRLAAPFGSPLAAKGEPALRAGLGDPIHSTRGVGWWLGLLATRSGGPALVVGAVTAERQRTAILPALPAAGTASLALRIGTTGEVITVPRGGSATLETLALIAGADPAGGLQRYATEVGRRTSPLREEAVVDPTGWWSWNVFFDKVTEQQIVDHAAFLRDELAPQGFKLVELDDGYEQLWGEWEATDPSRFPSGLAGLSQKVRASGLSVGLWLAPFLVDETAALAKNHPDWFVRDPQTGKPLRHAQLGVRGTALVLDPTHPGAAAHLRDLFGRLHKAGFSLFKLDFLYAGALPGQRREAVTGIEALRLGLELIRQAAPGAHINLCGMPVLPAVGLGHSLRYGADIAFTVAPPGLGQIAHEARNVMLRSFLDPLIRNDPDQVLVRAPLTTDEARSAATLAAMAGFYTAGDDLTALPADRLAILADPALLTVARGRSALPLDPLAAPSDDVFLSPVTDPGLWSNDPRSVPPSRYYREGAPAYLALFNWRTTAQTIQVDLRELGHAGARVRELWSGRDLGDGSDTVTVELRRHGVALLEIGP